MILTEQLAMKYAKYRLRFLEGSHGAYQGPQLGVQDPATDDYLVDVAVPGLPVQHVPAQSRDTRVSFLRNPTRPLGEPSAFVVATKLSVDPPTATAPGDLESAAIKNMEHGDNVLHASWAFITFIAEYVVTYDPSCLTTALGILRSFQRLGNYSNGHGEDPIRANRPAGEFWGYILRGDPVDDGSDTERIQKWLEDTSTESPLEPSPDQYTSLFCTSLIAKRILAESQAADAANWPMSADHVQLRVDILNCIDERVRACHRYVARHCHYFLKHPTHRMVKRGAWCWQFAYEFADVACTVLNENFDSHFEPFLLDLLPEIISAFVPADSAHFADANADHISDLILDGIESAILDFSIKNVRDAIFATMTATIPILNETVDLLSFISDRAGLKTDVDGKIKHAVRHWIDVTIKPALKAFLKAAIQTLLDAGIALDRAASKILAKLLFKISADVFFASNIVALQPNGILKSSIPASLFFDMGLFDPGLLDSVIDVALDFEVVTNGFTVKILGIEKSIGEISWGHFNLQAASIPALDWRNLLGGLSLPVDLNAREWIHKAAEYNGFDDAWIAQKLQQIADLNPFRGDFYPFGYFVLMSVNGSFARYAFGDGSAFPGLFDNGLFASLNYRLHGQTSVLSILERQLAIAPDNFPNGRSNTIWDEDFLWLRNRNPGDSASDKLYSGLDFLCASAIAMSAKPIENRTILRDAIEKVLEEDAAIDVAEGAGIYNLRFRGPVSGSSPAFVPSVDNIGDSTNWSVGVVFKFPGGPGRVRVRVGNTGAPDDVIEFRQSAPGKMVSVPRSDVGISIESVDVGVSGVLVVTLA